MSLLPRELGWIIQDAAGHMKLRYSNDLRTDFNLKIVRYRLAKPGSFCVPFAYHRDTHGENQSYRRIREGTPMRAGTESDGGSRCRCSGTRASRDWCQDLASPLHPAE